MIVNIRGTSGSGKSTVARNVMKRYDSVSPHHIEGRKQPLYYICDTQGGFQQLAVIGHYETACGGTDTITKMDEIFEIIRDLATRGYNVLFEGLLLSAEFNRMAALAKDFDCVVLGLTEVPLDVCFDSIMARRKEKADKAGREPKPPGPNMRKNLESKWKGTVQTCARLEAAGCRVYKCTRERALKLCLAELECPPCG